MVHSISVFRIAYLLAAKIINGFVLGVTKKSLRKSLKAHYFFFFTARDFLDPQE